jgi:arabinose-5-phosphate isomerase
MTLKPVPQPASDPLADAREVLRTEIAALEQLNQKLGADFTKAVLALGEIKGRVVVTGIGKSGHIARKLAATFASTGTPSLFVHPAEASHGDLGMVTRADAVVALSNSGEASELSDIVAYAKRFSIPLIAITSRADSTLGSAANIVLQIPQAEEACPLGLAPTSSTTMMLALGDALAVALMKQRGFSATDYKDMHPGGKLGKKLLLVHELMHKDAAVPLAKEDAGMNEVIITMTAKTFGCCGILDKSEKLIGIITDGDLRRHMGDAGLLSKRAADIMTKGPKTIGPNSLAAEALGRMNEKKVTSLFVINENGHVLGIIRMHDLLKEGVG